MQKEYTYLQDYKTYRRDFRKGNPASDIRPLSYEEFALECDAEEEQNDRDYRDHISRMTCSRRYI